MHLSERASTTNSNLVAGATVYTSTLVGKVGSTGDSTAAHLHMSMIIDGSEKMELVNTTDPQMLYKNVAFTY